MLSLPEPEASACVSQHWEEVPCPLCEAADEEEVLRVARPAGQPAYRLVRCRACGMGYLNPRPNEDSIGQYYQNDYECYQHTPRRLGGWWRRIRGYIDRLVLAHCYNYPHPQLRWHEKVLAAGLGTGLGWGRQSLTTLPFKGRGDMLDFGCGSGWYAQRMREQGWRVTGMDFSPHAARQAAERYHLRVLVGSLPHPAVAPESFDLITMGCVLEHVHWPHQVIAAAARALRPGGALVIAVPNLASLGFRYFGPDWWPLELPRHLLHFSPATLRRLVTVHGLEIDEERTVARKSWMRRSFAIARRRPGGGKFRRLLTNLGRVRLVPSLLTHWTVWSHRADCLLLRARRPERVSSRTFLPRLVPTTRDSHVPVEHDCLPGVKEPVG